MALRVCGNFMSEAMKVQQLTEINKSVIHIIAL